MIFFWLVLVMCAVSVGALAYALYAESKLEE